MFTGIVEELGTVDAVEPRAAGSQVRIRCRSVLEDLTEGASVAVNGVCLTATGLRPQSFAAHISPETLSRSNLGGLRPGSRVNLERPLSPSGRIGGHIVQGHVDATGELMSLAALGDENWWLKVRLPQELDPYIVEKGSISIDGISLTIAAVDRTVISATIIPHTYRNTTLSTYRPGSLLNIECDILAKYIAKIVRNRGPETPLTVDGLREKGY